MLAVRGELADRVSEIAKHRGFTLFSFVNDALDSAIKIEQQGLTVDEVLQGHRTLQAAKEAGFVPCPESLLYEAVDLAYWAEGERLSDSWLEAGARCAKLYLVREIHSPLDRFKRDIRDLTWHASDISLDEGKADRNLIVRCLGRKFSEGYALLFSRFLEGAFSTLGYSCERREVAKGALVLEMVRKAL
jgi:hypothetical protein